MYAGILRSHSKGWGHTVWGSAHTLKLLVNGVQQAGKDEHGPLPVVRGSRRRPHGWQGSSPSTAEATEAPQPGVSGTPCVLWAGLSTWPPASSPAPLCPQVLLRPRPVPPHPARQGQAEQCGWGRRSGKRGHRVGAGQTWGGQRRGWPGSPPPHPGPQHPLWGGPQAVPRHLGDWLESQL